jgi:hypothetical protein
LTKNPLDKSSYGKNRKSTTGALVTMPTSTQRPDSTDTACDQDSLEQSRHKK